MNPVCHMQSTGAAYIYNFDSKSLERPAKLWFGSIKPQLEVMKNNADIEFGNLLWNRKETGGKQNVRKTEEKERYSNITVFECANKKYSFSLAIIFRG